MDISKREGGQERMREQSLDFLHRLNDGGLLYLNRYLERKCGCGVFHISPSDRLIYDGNQTERVKTLKKSILQNLQDQDWYYDAENESMVWRYRVNEYRNLFVFFPVTEDRTEAILDDLGEITAPLGYFLKGLYYSFGHYKMLLQNQAAKIFQPDSSYWESVLDERLFDPEISARVIVYRPEGAEERLPEMRHLLSNLALRDGGSDILTYAWRGRVIQIVPAAYPVRTEPSQTDRRFGMYPVYLHRELLREHFSTDFTVAVGSELPAPQVYRSFLTAMMTDFYLDYFRKEEKIRGYEEIAPSKWFSYPFLEKRLPELEKKYAPLNRYESERNGWLFSTLRELVRSQFNYQEAAKKLHVHLNTLYYRQEKLSELLSSDLAGFEDRVALYHELFAYDFAQFLRESEARSEAQV
jgi:hypothetical protein